jgi:hypothetical protein
MVGLKNGHPPVDLERMLRIWFVQHWFSLTKNKPKARDPKMHSIRKESQW